MSTVQLNLDDDLVALLEADKKPVEAAALELIVLELHRQGKLSGGKAAELLKISRLEFIHRAADAGIPYFSFTREEWEQEMAEVNKLCQTPSSTPAP